MADFEPRRYKFPSTKILHKSNVQADIDQNPQLAQCYGVRPRSAPRAEVKEFDGQRTNGSQYALLTPYAKALLQAGLQTASERDLRPQAGFVAFQLLLCA